MDDTMDDTTTTNTIAIYVPRCILIMIQSLLTLLLVHRVDEVT